VVALSECEIRDDVLSDEGEILLDLEAVGSMRRRGRGRG